MTEAETMKTESLLSEDDLARCKEVVEHRARMRELSSNLQLKGPEAPVVGTKKSNGLEKVTIKDLTERHKMTVGERKELPFSCAQCGRHFSQPRYMQRHKCVTTRKKG